MRRTDDEAPRTRGRAHRIAHPVTLVSATAAEDQWWTPQRAPDLLLDPFGRPATPQDTIVVGAERPVARGRGAPLSAGPIEGRAGPGDPAVAEGSAPGAALVRGFLLVALAWWLGAGADPWPVLGAGVCAVMTGVLLGRYRADLARADAPFWAVASALLVGAVPTGAAAVGLVVVWGLGCLQARPEPALRVWLLAGGVAGAVAAVGTGFARALSALADGSTGGAPPTEATVPVVVLVGLVQIIQLGPGWVCGVPEWWALSSATPDSSAPAGPADRGWLLPATTRQVRREADHALRLVAAVVSVAVIVAAPMAAGAQLGPVERGGCLVLLATVSTVLVVWSATARLASVRWWYWAAAATSGGSAVVVGSVWGAVPTAMVLLGLGVGLLWVSVRGGRVWDLFWWPRPHPGAVPWLVALAGVAGVVSTGLPSALVG